MNDRVNADITYASDILTSGVPEYWEEHRGPALDDCDGYMLSKRLLLRDAKVPDEDIFLESCLTETGEGHAVLRVRLEDNTDVILDNRQQSLETPASLRQIGYRFISHIRSDGVGGWRDSGG